MRTPDKVTPAPIIELALKRIVSKPSCGNGSRSRWWARSGFRIEGLDNDHGTAAGRTYIIVVSDVVVVGRFLDAVVFVGNDQQLPYNCKVVGPDVTGEESVMADPMEAGR